MIKKYHTGGVVSGGRLPFVGERVCGFGLRNDEIAVRLTPGRGVLRIVPGETLAPGDWVALGEDGRLHKAEQGAPRSFQLPLSARFDGPYVEWDV
jgi:hypothetical protein